MKTLFILTLALGGFLKLKAQNTAEYIAEHAVIAQNLMHDYKIPASVILGIAIHESGAGSSKIAHHLNNHFGVKGPNNSSQIRSAYRQYDSDEESFNHFVEVMETRSPFNQLFEKYNQYDYQGWVRGIQRSGYAHSRTWASQVIGLIKKYALYQYDERPADYQEPAYQRPSRRIAKSSPRHKTYQVKPGDSLSVIAERLGTNTKSLLAKNDLKSDKLKPGQKLKY